jgi:hypothetical protein
MKTDIDKETVSVMRKRKQKLGRSGAFCAFLQVILKPRLGPKFYIFRHFFFAAAKCAKNK